MAYKRKRVPAGNTRVVRPRVAPRRFVRVKRRFPLYKGPQISANVSRFQKVRYVQDIILDPPAQGLAIAPFACNSCFRPSQGAQTGHQPMRWDQLTQFYSEYVVVGAKIKVTRMTPYSTDGVSIPDCWGIYLDNNVNAPPRYRDMIESGRGKYRLSNATNAMRSQSITMGFSLKKYFNLKDVKDNFTLFGAEVSANPAKMAYFNIWCGALDEDSMANPPPTSYLVQIDYAVLLSKPRDLPPS